MAFAPQRNNIPIILNHSGILYRTIIGGLLAFIFMVCTAGLANATHLRAGDIAAVRDTNNPLRYTFTLSLYTDSVSPVVDFTTTLYFGDGQSQTKAYISRTGIISKGTWVSIYKFDHTFSTAGEYLVYYYNSFRNTSLNMSNPEATTFYVETLLVIDPNLGLNSSPILQKFPVDFAAIGRKFKHNPAAFDPDGDSLSYKLVNCKQYLQSQQLASDVGNYVNPADVSLGGLTEDGSAAAYCSVDPITGTLTWDAPNYVTNGSKNFSVAIQVREWRYDTASHRRYTIGYVHRDFQIVVSDSRNHPPKIKIPNDTCVIAGEGILNAPIKVTDEDIGDRATLKLNSVLAGQGNPVPTFNNNCPPRQATPFSCNFYWAPNCNQVREMPYDMVFSAEDQGIPAPALVDQQVWRIKVIGPRPKNLLAQAAGGVINLTWNSYVATQCQKAVSIDIYRAEDTSNFSRGKCAVGLTGTQFTRIATVPANATTFQDINDGKPFKRGKVYWYSLVANFPAPGLGTSLAALPDSAKLDLTLPLLLHVSVLKTDSVNGKILVNYTKPFKVDGPGPYRYRLQRAEGETGNGFSTIFSSMNLQDTTYVDTLLNTLRKDYNYRLAFDYRLVTPPVLSDSEAIASSVKLSPVGTGPKTIALTWEASVPWQNSGYMHYIYRQINGVLTLLDSVKGNTSNGGSYVDNGSALNGTAKLEMGKKYNYQVVTQGRYTDPRVKQLLVNYSPIREGRTLDTIPPCKPSKFGDFSNTPCNNCQVYNASEQFNTLQWSDSLSACDSDLVAYRVYYRPYNVGSFTKVADIPLGTNIFRHNNNGSLAGCYYLTSVDRSGNESQPTDAICKDNCAIFNLPNVFTPNGDGINSTFRPQCIANGTVQINGLMIFSRWGKKVFDLADNPDLGFNWDGKGTDGAALPVGVYFYKAEIRFIKLDPKQENQKLTGWVTILK